MTGLPWDRTPVASSLLATRNPLVKLIVLFVVSIVVMFWFDPLRPGVLWALLLVGTVVGAKLSPKALLVSQLVFAGFALGTLLVNIVTRPDDPDALAIGFSLAFRTMAIGTASVAFIASTDAVALVTSLHENGRLPARFAYSLLAGYRILEDLPREWALLAAADGVRDPQQRRPGAAALGRRAFALLVVSIRKGERLAQSLELRGLERQPRTLWRPVVITPADAAFACAVVAVVVGVWFLR